VHSFSTPSITPYLVIPPSCPALSTAPVVVAIGPAGSVPIGRGDPRGTVRSVRGPVGVVVRFGVGLWGRTLESDFGVGLWGRTLGLDFGGVTHKGNQNPSYPHKFPDILRKITHFLALPAELKVLFTESYGISAYSVTGRINAQRPDGSSCTSLSR
jgi:hypothetical protein